MASPRDLSRPTPLPPLPAPHPAGICRLAGRRWPGRQCLERTEPAVLAHGKLGVWPHPRSLPLHQQGQWAADTVVPHGGAPSVSPPPRKGLKDIAQRSWWKVRGEDPDLLRTVPRVEREEQTGRPREPALAMWGRLWEPLLVPVRSRESCGLRAGRGPGPPVPRGAGMRTSPLRPASPRMAGTLSSSPGGLRGNVGAAKPVHPSPGRP